MTPHILRLPAFVVVLTLLWLGPVQTASAQLLAAKDGPIVYGHHHVNVSSVEEAKKFWVDGLGGVPVKVGTSPNEIIKFPNALVFLRVQKPTGGTKGTTVDHVAFAVTNLRQVVDRLKAGGFRLVTAAEAPSNITVKDDIGAIPAGPSSALAYVMGPDDLKVELVEPRAPAAPVVSHHLHFFGPSKEMQAWYIKTFGATEAPSANPAAFVAATLPGLIMNFASAPATPVGTQGRALDHIGFEVKGLEAFTKKLEAEGVKFAVPYRDVPALGIHIAFFTDPWGTYIELTEGLDKVQ